MRENKKRINILSSLLFMGMIIAILSNINFIREEQIYQNTNEPITTLPPSQSSFERLWTYNGFDDMLSIAISENGQYTAAGCANTNFYLFNRTDPVPKIDYNTPNDILSVAISADGSYSIAGSASRSIYLFDKSGLVWNKNLGDDVGCVDISSDGTYIVAGTDNNEVYLFNNASPTELWSRIVSGKVLSIAISSDGQYIVAGTDNNYIYLFSQTSSTPLWSIQRSDQIYSVAISSEGSYIAAGSRNDYVYVFESSSSTPIRSYNTGNDVYSVSISSDGQYIAAGNIADFVYLYDRSSPTPVWSFTNGGAGDFRTVDISADGNFIIAGSYDNKVYIFNQSSSTPMWSYTTGGVVLSVSISSDGRYFTAGGIDNNVYLFDQTFPLGPCEISSNAGIPDNNGMFHLNWNASLWADNYSLYSHDSVIYEINGNGTLISEDLTNFSHAISGLGDGTYYYAILTRNKAYNSTSNCVAVTVEFPDSLADFDVIENASYSEYETGFRAIENNYYNVSIPDDWNPISWNIENISSFVKEQIVNDTVFEDSQGSSPWTAESQTTGLGQLFNSWQPTAANPEFVRTYMRNELGGYEDGNYAYFGQDLSNVSSTKEIQLGKLIQEEDETTLNWNLGLIPTEFTTDLATPYGGEYNPPYDQMFLGQMSGYSYIYIDPDSGASGRNPSSSWNHFIDLPYRVDHAQISITWAVDAMSSFEADDEYRVAARINQEYIAGSDLIAKTDFLPYAGTENALIVYNLAGHVDHGFITRTYNITRHLNNRVGENTFDVGVWAKNPTHLGDDDLIFAKFSSIEIMYNTTDKYEVAELEFDLEVTDNNEYGYNSFIKNGNASIVLFLDNSTINDTIRVLDCHQLEIFGSTDGLGQPTHHTLSIPHEYIDFLATDDLELKIGILFDTDFSAKISYYFDYDNVTFSINYKHDNITYSGLEYNIDDTGWGVCPNSLDVATSGWSESNAHNIQFRSTNFTDSLAINFDTDFKVNSTLGVPNFAWSNYSMNDIGDPYGTWNISYDNTDSYYRLVTSPYFEAIQYSIGFMNLPAFDSLQSSSSNWYVFNGIKPDLSNVSKSDVIRFNYGTDPKNQSARIENAQVAGIWTLQARQPNVILNCTYNTTEEYETTPSYFSNEVLQYNFSLIEDDPVNGNYSLIVYNETMDKLATYPQNLPSSTDPVLGIIDLSVGFVLGRYYLSIEWNDTSTTPDRTLRFGSIITDFYVLNGTISEIHSPNATVYIGFNATFELSFRTAIGGYGISSPTLTVYDNTTGTLELWGLNWTGEYQAYYTSLPNGNFSFQLGTDGASAGNRKIVFKCQKPLHQTQYLTFDLDITALATYLEVNITIGATLNGQQWVLNSNNLPFVNDTTSSILQLNLTDGLSGIGQAGGLVLGTFGGGMGSFFTAIDLGEGLYNLTLNTMGQDATPEDGNITLYIICSASGYNSVIKNVTVIIKRITTQVTVQNINPLYEEGTVSIYALMENNHTESPQDNNYGFLTFYIHQGGSINLTGTLNFIMFGLYTTDATLTGLTAGTYYMYINASANNCVNSTSNQIQFTIISQVPTSIDLSVDPDTVRILQQFEISITLGYGLNASVIPDQTVYFNVTIEKLGQETISFIVEGTTDATGISTYNYIISEAYKDGTLTINVTYNGEANKQASKASVVKIINGRIPITINITDIPTFIRVGYSATYRGSIAVDGASISYRELFFIAWYESGIPFLTQQIFTDTDGRFEYTISEIADGYDNLTVWIEHKKTTTVAYNWTTLTTVILPKWEVNFTYDTLPLIIRFGQEISFNLVVSCTQNASLSFEGLAIVFTFSYGTTVEIYTKFIDDTNKILFVYTVANSFSGDLNVSIVFGGTSKFTSYNIFFSQAINPKIQVQLAFVVTPDSQYMIGENYFSVLVTDENSNPIEGLEIIFILLNEGGTEVSRTVATTDENGIASVSINFQEVGNKFTLKVSFAEEGIYSGSLLTSEEIRVVDGFILFLDLLPFILLGLAIVSGVSFGYYRGVVVPKKKRHRESLKQMYQRMFDVENIQHIIILTDSGIPCYSKSLSDIPIDETLISGFLSAITSFGAEIGDKMKDDSSIKGSEYDASKEKDTKSRLQELSYQRFKIILREGLMIRTALLLLKRPSKTLMTKLERFTAEFESTFEPRIKKFSGEIFKDIEVDPLIEKIFEADLLYPHRVIERKIEAYSISTPKKDLSREILRRAMRGEFESSFYLRDMINHLKTHDIDEVASFNSLETLKKERVIFAINPRTNFLIEQLKPYTVLLDDEDRAVLFALYNGILDQKSIKKYVNKEQKIALSKDINYILKKFEKMRIILEDYNLNNTGLAIATILQLIPEL